MVLRSTIMEQNPGTVHTTLQKTTLRPSQDVHKTTVDDQNQKAPKPQRHHHADRLLGSWQVFLPREGPATER